ncbi:hypothetical protein [Serratia marcescens]|uniref:hypothetical protein n=1 Tax=Serratia marcescens TaxID=615 RepID=UPI003FA68336
MDFNKETWAFIGAATGIAIPLIFNTIKDVIFERNKRFTERRYIGVQLVFLLDKFTSHCADVAWDDGFDEFGSPGEPRQDQVSLPTFDLSSVKGEYKFLSAQFIYKLHLINIKLIKIHNALKEEGLFCDDELDGYYNLRRRLFVDLGVYADNLNREICNVFKIKHESWDEGRSPRDYLESSKMNLWKAKARREFSKMERKAKRIMR